VFLSRLAETLATCASGAEAGAVIERIQDAVATPGPRGQYSPRRLPVCAHLAEAVATARAHSEPISRLAESFCAIEPLLLWAPRAGSGAFASANWPQGHANAVIVGPNGLEGRPDLQIGVSLLAPHVRYPDHSHPPEEVYLVLSPGRFQHGASDWFEPGIGGTFHNEPNINHAMASDVAPLFAIWCLWQ
jgi:hypothetical protein